MKQGEQSVMERKERTAGWRCWSRLLVVVLSPQFHGAVWYDHGGSVHCIFGDEHNTRTRSIAAYRTIGASKLLEEHRFELSTLWPGSVNLNEKML